MLRRILICFVVFGAMMPLMMEQDTREYPTSIITPVSSPGSPTRSLLTTPTPSQAVPTILSPYPTATLSEALVLINQATVVFAAPDNTSAILLPRVSAGAFARLLAVTQDRRWYRIEIGNTIGWISSTAATIIGQPSGLYEVIEQTPTPTIAPIATERMVGSHPTIRFNGTVQVYSGADFFYPLAGMIVSGQSAEILAMASGRGGDWFLIRYENGAGWILPPVGDIEGDLSTLPQVQIPSVPGTNLNVPQYLVPHHLDSLLPSSTPSPELLVTPTLMGGSVRVAESIEVILEPDLPRGAYTTEQLITAGNTLQMRLAQYPITDYTVEVNEVTNTIHVHFPDNPYRDEIIRVISQEGLFEAVDFRDQSLELRSALLSNTILTSGYFARESQRIQLLSEAYNVTTSDQLDTVGFAFSNRRRNPLESSQPFPTLFDNSAVASASLIPDFDRGLVITLTDEGMSRFSGYPADRLIAFTMDGRILDVPLANTIRQTFTLDLQYTAEVANQLVVLLRSGSLPFPLRPLRVTYLNG